MPNVMLIANSYLDQSGTHILIRHTDPCFCKDAKDEDTLGLPVVGSLYVHYIRTKVLVKMQKHSTFFMLIKLY